MLSYCLQHQVLLRDQELCLTVSVSFLLLESACLRMGKSWRMVSFPLSWFTHRCCRFPLMEVRAHMATRVMEWEVRRVRIMAPWLSLKFKRTFSKAPS